MFPSRHNSSSGNGGSRQKKYLKPTIQLATNSQTANRNVTRANCHKLTASCVYVYALEWRQASGGRAVDNIPSHSECTALTRNVTNYLFGNNVKRKQEFIIETLEYFRLFFCFFKLLFRNSTSTKDE
jgi:hypothetical protein